MDDNWQKVREVFDAALCCNPKERLKFIIDACGDDESILQEVESLLSSLGSAEDFLETPVAVQVADIINPSAPPLSSGTTFGHYEIIEQIGAGGMGEVYLAKDKKLERLVAVKILNGKFACHESNLKRFIKEAKAASALNHPNILVIHEIGRSNDTHFIVSEYIKGETLRQVLKTRTIQLPEILDIAIQIANALVAAHEARLIHRDVKPENIIIRPDGYAKILDFGLAKLVKNENLSFLNLKNSTIEQAQTGKGVILGTVKYMSPEQAKGEPVDERTDIFSLGVVVYEMISGRTPFAGDSHSETFANLINKEPLPLSNFADNVPEEVERVVLKMLSKDKDARYLSMKEALADLKDLKNNLPLDEKFEQINRRIASKTESVRATTDDAAHRKTGKMQNVFWSRIKQRNSAVAAVLMLLLFGAIGSGYYFSYAGKAVGNERKSIAVLPLKPINTAARDEIYEVGIADSLIQRLGSTKGFIVRPLSAVRKYTDLEQDPLAAGQEQQVDYVLASNYQVANGKIRITAQLLNVKTGQIEETYKSEKEASDVFVVEDSVAGDVGNLLLARFAISPSGSPAEKRGTNNEEAYRLYLQGMYLLDKENLAASKRALELFDKALALDPNYAKAWAGKARAHCNYAHWGGNSSVAEFANAKPALDRAFALDNNLAEAHAVLGMIKNDYEWDFAEAEKQFRRAIELDPNNDIIYRWFGYCLSEHGRHDEAIAMIKRAIDLNPSYIVSQTQYGQTLYFARQYDDAVKQLERVVEMDSSSVFAYSMLWRCYHKKGDYQRAYESLMKLLQLIGTKDDVLKDFETVYSKSGWQGVLLKDLEMVKGGDANDSKAYLTAELSELTGDREQSLLYLDEAIKNRSLDIPAIVGDPLFDSLRGDPRFEAMVKKVEAR